MDFHELKTKEDNDMTPNPFAARQESGEWVEGYISIEFLNKHFGHLETVEEMKRATDSEGLKLYFSWLRDKGILD